MKKSPIRQACAEKLESETDSLKRERADGIKVLGYTCHAFPASVAAGLGVRPLRVLCGTSADSETAGEQVVRADVCPLVKTLLGNVNEGRGVHGMVDIWAGLFTCDAMRRGLDVLQARLAKEVHPVQLPATRTPEAASYYADQIARLVADIEARHGLRFDPDHTLSWQRESERAAAVLSRAARTGSVSPLDLHAMFHLFFAARPAGLADFFGELIESAGPFNAAKMILLAGSPLSLEDTVLLEELEARGFGIVPLNCTGLNSVEAEAAAPGDKDLIRSLALRSFYLPACARARPNSEVYERIRAARSAMNPSGLIVKSLTFCDHWHTERERMRRGFDMPVLVFDSDYATGGRERLISRIDAFLETME